MTQLQSISPARAAELLREGAMLVDIREADEHARERIPGARHHALSRIADGIPAPAQGVVIFHCRSGMRTKSNAAALAGQAGGCDAFLLEGGIDAWKKAGLPVNIDRRQPIDMMRQVQIGAGTLALLGVLLGFLVDPVFYALSGFVGAGLLVAGVTGFCGMARVLALMPWNRRMQNA